jgi:exopolysaccharide biosynthesis polyprenyl glycosylphosphotransferase
MTGRAQQYAGEEARTRSGDRIAVPGAESAAPETRPDGQREPLRFWRDALRRRMLAAADLTAASLALSVMVARGTDITWALLTLPVWIVAGKLIGNYDRDHRSLRHMTLDEVGPIAAWAVVCVVSTSFLLELTPAASVHGGEVLAGWVVATAGAFTLRALARWVWRRATPRERTVVIGEGDLAKSIRRKLTLFPDMHLELVGGASSTTPDLPKTIAGADRVIVASSSAAPDLVAFLVSHCREEEVKLSVISPLRGRSRPSARIGQVADLPILEYETWDVSRSTMLLKRAFDLVFGGIVLLVTLPLFVPIAIAIAIESRGPIFFRQQRAGLEGEPFRMLKFRTMVRDAERRLAEVVSIEELRDPMFKVENDPRTTRVGRFLRRCSLDELPQLINVVRGQMSVVGPRPEEMAIVERYRPEHRFRLAVKPGLTGPMQVFGRGELTFGERLAVELDYVEGLSLGRDLRILAETVPVILRGHGAY